MDNPFLFSLLSIYLQIRSQLHASLIQQPSGYLQPFTDKTKCVTANIRNLHQKVVVRNCEDYPDEFQIWSFTEGQIKLVSLENRCLVVEEILDLGILKNETSIQNNKDLFKFKLGNGRV